MITSVERLDGYDDYDMAVCQAHIRVPNQKRVIFNFGACHMVSTMVQFLHFDDRMAETTASNNMDTYAKETKKVIMNIDKYKEPLDILIGFLIYDLITLYNGDGH